MKLPRKIDFLIPRISKYDVLHHFTRKLYEAFIRAGYQCRLVQQKDQFTLKDPPELSIGFNGVPRNEKKELVCDLQGIPYLAYLVDPPYHFPHLFKSPNLIMSCDDRMGCRLLQVLDFERTLFLPHAVEPELLDEPDVKKGFDVVMLASFIDYEERRKKWKQDYPTLVCRCMDQVIEMTFEDPKISYIAALDYVMEQIQRKGAQKIFEKCSFFKILEDLEYYIKGRDRSALAKSLGDIPLHIFGGSINTLGWKQYLRKSRAITVYHAVNFQQALEILKKSKILLNPSLKNKEGAHERIFAGLACGALVITTESSYLMKNFKSDESLVYYRHPDLSSVQENVIKYLENEELRREVVRKGKEQVREGETWDQRVQLIEKELPPLLKKMKSK